MQHMYWFNIKRLLCALKIEIPYMESTAVTTMNETRYKNILTEWYIGFEGNGGVKRKGTRDQRWYNFFLNSRIFSNVKCTYYKSAKYRTTCIQKFCTIVDPLLPSFLHHHCLQIIPLTFSVRMFLYLVSFIFFFFK